MSNFWRSLPKVGAMPGGTSEDARTYIESLAKNLHKKETERQAPPRFAECRVLRPLTPPRQILFLLRRQLVDLDSHGLELQFGYALVQVIRHSVDSFLE
jgi:hypothetical protein